MWISGRILCKPVTWLHGILHMLQKEAALALVALYMLGDGADAAPLPRLALPTRVFGLKAWSLLNIWVIHVARVTGKLISTAFDCAPCYGKASAVHF